MGPIWLPTRGRGSEVRAGSGFPTPPIPIGAGGAWYRSDYTGGVSSGSLALWPDISGNGNDATQATMASQPTVFANQINGLPGVVFDGVDDLMAFLQVSGLTVFIVANKSSNIHNSVVLSSTTNAGKYLSLPDQASGQGSDYGADGGSAVYGPLGDSNEFRIVSCVETGSAFTIYRNGVSGSPSATQDGTRFIDTIGYSSSTTYSLTGTIAEIFIVPYVATATQRQTVQADAGSRYNIPLGQPQISLVDFNGLSGVNFVTGAGGEFFDTFDTGTINYRPWYNTGTESSPGGPGNTPIEVDISPTAAASDIALATVNAINAAFPSKFVCAQVNGGGTNTAVQISTLPLSGEYASTDDTVDGNTGAAFSTTQQGSGNS